MCIPPAQSALPTTTPTSAIATREPLLLSVFLLKALSLSPNQNNSSLDGLEVLHPFLVDASVVDAYLTQSICKTTMRPRALNLLGSAV